MNIVDATRSYEAWLAKQIPLIRADVDEKHLLMQDSPFALLRGAFYRWLTVWNELPQKIASATRVLAEGDLHVENFGTWRDREGRLVWGINDFDESATLPWTLDIVRLATSALLATDALGVALKPRAIVEAIETGYRDVMRSGGEPFVLAEHHVWLRRIAENQLRDPQAFWKKLSSLPAAGSIPAPARKALLAALPERGIPVRLARRRAGVGSRGHLRFVALAKWRGGLLARETKALAPSAIAWADARASTRVRYPEIVSRAVRCPDPGFAIHGNWIVRRLAPDCAKVNASDLPDTSLEASMLQAMGREAANVHLGSSGALRGVRRDLARLKKNWLLDAAKEMAKATEHDWKDWRKRR
ncbi:MAG TPA: DUF2252 family protein [bacterium]|nr:DUF2252 family protein [bacterium]